MSVLPIGRWLRRTDSPAPRPHAAPVSAPQFASGTDDATVGRLIDAAGALVHLIGVYAHDTDARTAGDARDRAESWRRHLTLGLGHPEHERDDKEDAPAPASVGLAQRDWEGAVRHAVAERKSEHGHVERSMTELRDTIWTLVRGLHAVTDAEQTAGQATASATRRLTGWVSEAPPSQVRGVALAALGELAHLIARREREREKQIAALGDQVAALGAALEEARREGATDVLTGLGNRRAFDAAVEHAVALNGLWQQKICLVLLDVDGLKQVNDTLGHASGDVALQTIAGQLSRVFLRRTDVLTRIGGDDFAVLLRDTSGDEAVRATTRLAALTDATRVTSASDAASNSPGLQVGISAGVAVLKSGESAQEWTARADAALYAAKRAGRGRVELAE